MKPHWWIAALLLLLAACSCAQIETGQTRPFEWTQQDYTLPPGIKVYSGLAVSDDGSPVRAWYADVDLNDTTLHLAPYLSDAPAGKEPASLIANKAGAVIAINGGYFDVSSVPARTFSLVRRDSVTYSSNVGRVIRPGREYFVTRSALGIMPDGTLSFAWVGTFPDGMRAFAQPNPNANGTPALPLDPNLPPAAPWNPPSAIGAGPRLLQNGEIKITYDEEAFFGSGFGRDNPYPRAAVGWTAANHLILFATDGKQPDHSIGLSLPDLARTLKDLNCTEAMNLDGGGSETLVVNGIAVNKPSDGQERPVTSILAVLSTPPVNAEPPVNPNGFTDGHQTLGG